MSDIKHTGSLPDEVAATAAAALALRDLVRFHQHLALVQLHADDPDGGARILAWTATVPPAADVEANYALLIYSLTRREIDSASGEVAVLRLVEHIIGDEELQRGRVSAGGDLLVAVQLLQALRRLADTAVIGGLVGDAMLGRGGPGRVEGGDDDQAGEEIAGNRVQAREAPVGQVPVAQPETPTQRPPEAISDAAPAMSLLRLAERWHELGDQFNSPATRPDDLNVDVAIAQRWALEAQIIATAARGDADLIAKAGVLRRLLEEDGQPTDRVGRFTLSVLDDFDELAGDVI